MSRMVAAMVRHASETRRLSTLLMTVHTSSQAGWTEDSSAVLLASTGRSVSAHEENPASECYAEIIGREEPIGQNEAKILGLVQCYIGSGDLDQARIWADYAMAKPVSRAEPAYYMCKALREKEHYALAYYYYLLASRAPKPAPNEDFPVEDAVYDYLLEFEKSIIWYYVGAFSDRSTLRHGLALCMRLLENRLLPSDLATIVYNNIPVYTQPLRGNTRTLRAEKSHEEPWRFSTPTFLGHDILIREVTYYAADDGSYDVSQGSQVKTRLLVDGSNQYITVRESESFHHQIAEKGWHHPDAYVQGLEDTRVVTTRDHSDASIVYTLSASMEYSRNEQYMNQVLGILDPKDWTLTILNILKGPSGERTDKNWAFVGGIDRVVHEWYPSIIIGHIDLDEGEFVIDRSILAPPSFINMRGSTNGVLYNDEWWFVTHVVKHRHKERRVYTHRIIVLNLDLTVVTRHTLPFTFNADADIEYCLGLRVNSDGLTFGYSVRDRSSWIIETDWAEIKQLFD